MAAPALATSVPGRGRAASPERVLRWRRRVHLLFATSAQVRARMVAPACFATCSCGAGVVGPVNVRFRSKCQIGSRTQRHGLRGQGRSLRCGTRTAPTYAARGAAESVPRGDYSSGPIIPFASSDVHVLPSSACLLSRRTLAAGAVSARRPRHDGCRDARVFGKARFL